MHALPSEPGMISPMSDSHHAKLSMESLQPRPQHEVLAEALQRAIALGQLSPGDQLPTERALAELLGLGRMTVGRALRKLADQDLVITRRGRAGGTFVSDQPRRAKTRLQAVRQFGTDVEHNFEFRLSVEPMAARLAADRATRSQRRRLAELGRAEPDTLAMYRTLDSQFHLAVADACGNRLFAEAVREARAEFFAWADTLWMLSGQLTPDTAMFGHQHQGIGDAIVSGDAEAAEAQMREHLLASRASYQETLRGDLPTAVAARTSATRKRSTRGTP